MPTKQVQIVPTQSAILTTGYRSQERCTIAPDVLQQINPLGYWHFLQNSDRRFQVRIVSGGNVALYSVAGAPAADNAGLSGIPPSYKPSKARVSSTSLQERLKISSSAAVWGAVSSEVVDGNDFKEQLTSGTETFLVVIAPHGGAIEEWTDEQADLVRSNSQLVSHEVTCWWCAGKGPNAWDRWHITSTDISEHSFPLLKQIIDVPFTHAVSFHGFSPDPPASDPNEVLIGGFAGSLAGETLKKRIKKAIDDAIDAAKQANPLNTKPKPTVIAPASGDYAGLQERNIVNRLARGNGIQIEQSKAPRVNWYAEIAQAVASVYASLPDVYVRDNVSDTGAPHTGPLSLSPDIIVKQSPVANPQDAFGENSGTENNVALSDEVEYGQDNYLYVRVMNRGEEAAQQVTAQVFCSEAATLTTPKMWRPIGQVTIPSVPPGDVLTVSGAIAWPAAELPAKGHYCFVALVGTELDPMPDYTAIQSWDEFIGFIRYRNNITWRNFNVVNVIADTPPLPWLPKGFSELPFLAPGAPDRDLRMRLELGAELPDKAELLLDVPLEMLERMEPRPEIVEVDEERRTARTTIDHGRGQDLGEINFPAESRYEASLLIRIPEELREERNELFVRQLYEGMEVGRITWRLVRTGSDVSQTRQN